MERPFDAAIIGAGPAGSSAAITSCRAGLNTVLLEAGSFPHDRLCGEFLSPECADRLATLGIDIKSLGATPIHSAQILAPNGTSVDVPFPIPGWGISRRAFDATLAQVAVSLGADLRENSTVTQIAGDLLTGFCLQVSSGSKSSEIHARTVIAAHGKRTALDRALNRPFVRRPQPILALKRHFRGPPLNGRVVLHTFPGGYCGLAGIEGGLTNLCLLVREPVFRSAANSSNGHIESFVEWMQSQNTQLANWIARADPFDERWLSIAQVPFGSKAPTVGDILMAGDSGGLIAPLAGDGIAIALESGAMAAQRCIQFIEGKLDRRRMPALYTRDWERAFKTRLRLGRLLQHIILSPRLAHPAFRIASAFPSLGMWLMTHTRDLRALESPAI